MARSYRLASLNPPECSPADSRARGGACGGGDYATRLVNCGISPRFDGPESGFAKEKLLKYLADEAPVTGFRVMKNDVVTVRTARNPDALAARLEGCTRGEIRELSMASRRRLALVAANTDVIFRSFVTLTYPKGFPCDGELVKRHLAAILEALRRKALKPSYLWFLEFQKRGAPHFHIFLSYGLPDPLVPLHRKSGRIRKVVRVNAALQAWLSERWFRIVGSGDEKHLRAGAAWEVIEKPDGAARYVAKEAYKTFQKVVPDDFVNVGRFWGCSRNVPPDDGVLIPATQDGMAKIFPAECFGKESAPFPVLFGASKVYSELAGTSKDPLRIIAWKKTRKGETSELLSVPYSTKPSEKDHGSTMLNHRKGSSLIIQLILDRGG